jgi:acyl-CoA thioester hydrolase
MEFYHSLPVQIRFNDVDPARHVNNSVYQEFFDLGRMTYLGEILGSEMDFEGLSLIIAHYSVDFYKPVFLYDQVKVLTKVVSFGNKSLKMVQQLIDREPTLPRVISSSTLVCYDYRKRVSEILPDEWKIRINRAERGEVFFKKSM